MCASASVCGAGGGEAEIEVLEVPVARCIMLLCLRCRVYLCAVGTKLTGHKGCLF